MKLRPFFWNKLPWKPDHIWAKVPPGVLSEEQLSALEALFPQTAPSPQAKAVKAKSEPGSSLDFTSNCPLAVPHGTDGHKFAPFRTLTAVTRLTYE